MNLHLGWRWIEEIYTYKWDNKRDILVEWDNK